MADWQAAGSACFALWEAELFGWETILLALAAFVIVGLLTFLLTPYLALRLLLAVVCRTVFWTRVEGRALVPRSGGALLLCNPVSYLGWLLILCACPRRVRFVVLAGWANQGFLGWLLRRANAITPSGSGLAAVEQALTDAARALAAGEVVCIFAEGCRTADGHSFPYSRIFGLVASSSVPVVPVCLQQPQGSIFAMYGGRFVRRRPPDLPSPVWVRFAQPLPVGTNAADARQALQETSAKLAIDRNPATRPVHRQFVRMAARHPFRTCWIDSTAPGQDLTYGKAYVAATCLARHLRPLLGEARMVAVWLPPGRGSAIVNVALALLGKASVNLNYTANAESIQSALRQCECKHVLTAKRFTARLKIEPGPGVEVVHLEDLLPKITGGQKLLALASVVLFPGWLLERFVLGLGGHKPSDLATVIFSSGSTGDPKGVMLSHGNVVANCESMIQATNLGPADRAMGVLPFFHSFGYSVTLWAPLQIGASAVYHPDPRQAKEIGELCRKHQCTIYVSTATFLRFCLKKCDAEDFRTVRILMCGAEKLPPVLAEDFEKRFGVLPLEGYGCTELSPACAANMPDSTFGDRTQVHNKSGTVGPPLPGCAARVVNPETYQILPIGEEGMLMITGANVMQGYLHKPTLTAEVIREGWYVTGDMARLDAEGHITLTGRLSRFAKIGGEMVPLEKIEEALHEVLATSERVGVVTCVPDEARGERVVVLYVAAQLEVFGVAVSAWCKRLSGCGLPNLWVPSERDFHVVPELPVLGSGKVNLKEVKDLALSLARR